MAIKSYISKNFLYFFTIISGFVFIFIVSKYGFNMTRGYPFLAIFGTLFCYTASQINIQNKKFVTISEFLGNASYPLYLLNYVFIIIAQKLKFINDTFSLNNIFFLIISLIIAYYFHYIELIGIRLCKKLLKFT